MIREGHHLQADVDVVTNVFIRSASAMTINAAPTTMTTAFTGEAPT